MHLICDVMPASYNTHQACCTLPLPAAQLLPAHSCIQGLIAEQPCLSYPQLLLMCKGRDCGRYPANIELGNLAYFLVAPTLVYQTAYPRASRFHRRKFIWCDPVTDLGMASAVMLHIGGKDLPGPVQAAQTGLRAKAVQFRRSWLAVR